VGSSAKECGLTMQLWPILVRSDARTLAIDAGKMG